MKLGQSVYFQLYVFDKKLLDHLRSKDNWFFLNCIFNDQTINIFESLIWHHDMSVIKGLTQRVDIRRQ